MNTEERAVTIAAKAKLYGLTITAHDGIVTVTGRFAPGDKDAYIRMESDAYTILNMFRMVRPGSVWGSDSNSVGGAAALEHGRFVMNKSGCEKRLAAKFNGDRRLRLLLREPDPDPGERPVVRLLY